MQANYLPKFFVTLVEKWNKAMFLKGQYLVCLKKKHTFNPKWINPKINIGETELQKSASGTGDKESNSLQFE